MQFLTASSSLFFCRHKKKLFGGVFSYVLLSSLYTYTHIHCHTHSHTFTHTDTKFIKLTRINKQIFSWSKTRFTQKTFTLSLNFSLLVKNVGYLFFSEYLHVRLQVRFGCFLLDHCQHNIKQVCLFFSNCRLYFLMLKWVLTKRIIFNE